VTERDGKRDLVRMRWGVVPWWWSKPLKELRMATFNARAETVETKAVFRDAFKRSRCLIPMSGYYEWQNTPGGKQPWFFTARDGSPILTAAELWDEWKNRETGEPMRSCAMIITEPNGFAAQNPRPYAGLFDRGAICAVAERRGGSGYPKAGAERSPATLAGVEAGQ
jgi:putative SOS response-associated peptidase YedK